MPPKRKATAGDGGGGDGGDGDDGTAAVAVAAVASKNKKARAARNKDGVEAQKRGSRTQHKETKGKPRNGGPSADPAATPAPAAASSATAVGVVPKKNKQGQLVFPDYPKFRPNLTPKEILQLGSFGGTYFRPIKSSVTGKTYRDVWKEFPADWFQGLKIEQQVSNPKYFNSVNKYGVHCGGDLHMWESSGWIKECDPYGWFQWYCRFYLGRRCDDDERQVSRGLKVFGPTGRWRTQLCNRVLLKGTGAGDQAVSPKIRQLMQHWGYKLTEADLQAHAAKKAKKG